MGWNRNSCAESSVGVRCILIGFWPTEQRDSLAEWESAYYFKRNKSIFHLFIMLKELSMCSHEHLLLTHFLLFCRLIESSLGSIATKFNFFIHNLAQLRFSGLPSNDEPILSFSPKTYSFRQDGRIKEVSVFTYHKKYNPDKHYVSLVWFVETHACIIVLSCFLHWLCWSFKHLFFSYFFLPWMVQK